MADRRKIQNHWCETGHQSTRSLHKVFSRWVWANVRYLVHCARGWVEAFAPIHAVCYWRIVARTASTVHFFS
jgi:hypothetical protein